MHLREYIVNAALIGSDKKPVAAKELPEQLHDTSKWLEGNEDNETKFLKTASIALNYYRGGIEPIQIRLSIDQAAVESSPYCSDSATAVLKDILEEKYNNLCWFWTKCCVEKNRIVQPRLLPKYFEWGVNTKKTTLGLFLPAIGQRGIWLSKFKEEWNFISSESQEFDWETSPIGQRVKYLEQLRMVNSSEAPVKIREVWKEENAANRLELISTLAIHISKADEEFLLSITNDKSQKVKEKALQLLKLIPDSVIIDSYKNCLRQSIQIAQSKMLGLISRTNITVRLQVNDENIFKTGIQKLSSTKDISDEDFILMQMIAELPPSFWTSHFALDAAGVVKTFGKEELRKFQSSICQAVLKFADPLWAKEILEHFESPAVQLLLLVDENERINYAEKFLKENTNDVIAALRNADIHEWDRKFVKQLLPLLAENPYNYNKAFFESIIVYFPPEIVNDLEGSAPTDELKRGYWNGITEEIKKLLSLKEQIKKAFA